MLRPNQCVPTLLQNQLAPTRRDVRASPPMLLAEMNPPGPMSRRDRMSQDGRMSPTTRLVRMRPNVQTSPRDRTGRARRTRRISRRGPTNRRVRTSPRTFPARTHRRPARISRNVRRSLGVRRRQDRNRRMLRVRTRPSSDHKNRRNQAVRTCRDRNIRWSVRLRRRSRVLRSIKTRRTSSGRGSSRVRSHDLSHRSGLSSRNARHNHSGRTLRGPLRIGRTIRSRNSL